MRVRHCGVMSAFEVLQRELAERRVVASAANGTVTVTVNGDGALLDIAISDAALRGRHLDKLGPAVVQAVREARVEAGQFARERLAEALNPQPVVRQRPKPPPRQDDSEDDFFTGLGEYQ
jgi:DNA-binding protein YbaB